mgnify:CR=1 FL=1
MSSSHNDVGIINRVDKIWHEVKGDSVQVIDTTNAETPSKAAIKFSKKYDAHQQRNGGNQVISVMSHNKLNWYQYNVRAPIKTNENESAFNNSLSTNRKPQAIRRNYKNLAILLAQEASIAPQI